MTRLALLLAATLLATPAVAQDDLSASIAADLPTLMPVYRNLHEHPELSFQETRSAALLAKQARALGFEVTEQVGKTGVVAVMKNGAGPTLLVRADMGRAALGGEDGAGVRLNRDREDADRPHQPRHARVRPRHPHDDVARHRRADG